MVGISNQTLQACLSFAAGAIASGGMIWTIAEILNGLMAIPNLIGLLLLSPVVFRLTRSQFQLEEFFHRPRLLVKENPTTLFT